MKHTGDMWYIVEIGFSLKPFCCSSSCTSVSRVASDSRLTPWNNTPSSTSTTSPASRRHSVVAQLEMVARMQGVWWQVGKVKQSSGIPIIY